MNKEVKNLAQIYTQLEDEWLEEHHGTLAEDREFLKRAALAIYLKNQTLKEEK